MQRLLILLAALFAVGLCVPTGEAKLIKACSLSMRTPIFLFGQAKIFYQKIIYYLLSYLPFCSQTDQAYILMAAQAYPQSSYVLA